MAAADPYSDLETQRQSLAQALARATAGAAPPVIVDTVAWAIRTIDAALDGAASLNEAEHAAAQAVSELSRWIPAPARAQRRGGDPAVPIAEGSKTNMPRRPWWRLW
jgi:hypothetical protein